MDEEGEAGVLEDRAMARCEKVVEICGEVTPDPRQVGVALERETPVADPAGDLDQKLGVATRPPCPGIRPQIVERS
ncbi:MAG: hypothetical protein U0556_09715 [Dehalococcoidia bacterium]